MRGMRGRGEGGASLTPCRRTTVPRCATVPPAPASRSSRSTRSSVRSRCARRTGALSHSACHIGPLAPPLRTRAAPARAAARASQQLEHKQQTTSLTIKEDKAIMEEIKKLSSGKVACVGRGGEGRGGQGRGGQGWVGEGVA